jgi:murein DD-endopeptidase MepM/ murein hydrolase activator NlpD
MIHITHGFSRVTHGFKHMSDRVALLEGRAMPRLALTGLVLIWLAGCSADVTRFEASSNPFSNPFSSQTAQATPAAPSGHVASAPLAPAASVASAPLPTAPVAAPTPVAAASTQPVRGSAAGWSAVGGTPVVVGSGETLDTLSRRYGVPASALLSANGLSSAAEVKSGMRVVVPVYSAGSRAVASAKDAGKETVEADAKTKKRAEGVAANDDGKARKADERKAEKTNTEEKTAGLNKSEPSRKTEPTAVAKAETEKSDAVKTTIAKKQGIDNTPTGNVDPKAATAKEPTTSAQADASGSSPEFRWPARGRIIQGFKAGGNDGIDISVPQGTSVRAAESGEVVYAGDGLKGYGNLVLIKHPNGYVTAYANNAELDVKKGEQVKRGQIIAKSGDTGNVNAPQLHFELRKGSTPVDPTNYLAGL